MRWVSAISAVAGRPNSGYGHFLKARFGDANMTYTIPEPDQYLAEDSARIATMGTYLGRYEDLTLAAPLGPIGGRDKHVPATI